MREGREGAMKGEGGAIRVVIIDDHAVMRMGVKYALSFVDGIDLVGEYDGGEGAAAWVVRENPDVVLLDIRMPDKDGIAVLSEIMLARPKTAVLMLTTSAADEDIYRALNLGARGYLVKDRGCDEMCKAIMTLHQGGRYIPGYWVRTGYDDRTIFFDSEGNEIRLQRGKTWITVAGPDFLKVTYRDRK